MVCESMKAFVLSSIICCTLKYSVICSTTLLNTLFTSCAMEINQLVNGQGMKYLGMGPLSTLALIPRVLIKAWNTSTKKGTQ